MQKKISELTSAQSIIGGYPTNVVSGSDIIPIVNVSSGETMKSNISSIVGSGLERSSMTSLIIPNATVTIGSSDFYEPIYFYENDVNAFGYFVDIDFIANVSGSHDVIFRWSSAVDETKTINNDILNNGKTSERCLINETIVGSVFQGQNQVQSFTVDANGNFIFINEIDSDSDSNFNRLYSGSINSQSGVCDLVWEDPANPISVSLSYDYRAYTTLVSGSLIVRSENATKIKTRTYVDDWVSRSFSDNTPDDVLLVNTNEISGVCEVRCRAFFTGCPPVAFINEPTTGICHGTTTIYKLKSTGISVENPSYTGITGMFGVGNIYSASNINKSS